MKFKSIGEVLGSRKLLDNSENGAFPPLQKTFGYLCPDRKKLKNLKQKEKERWRSSFVKKNCISKKTLYREKTTIITQSPKEGGLSEPRRSLPLFQKKD